MKLKQLSGIIRGKVVVVDLASGEQLVKTESADKVFNGWLTHSEYEVNEITTKNDVIYIYISKAYQRRK